MRFSRPSTLATLHLDHEPAAGRVRALHIDNGKLELRDRHVLLEREMLEIEDPVLALELEEIVEERDEQRFTLDHAEDALEDEVGLWVGENGACHDDLTMPAGSGQQPGIYERPQLAEIQRVVIRLVLAEAKTQASVPRFVRAAVTSRLLPGGRGGT